MISADQFRSELRAQIDRAAKQGRPHVEVNSGELHRTLGAYPNDGRHSMPTCCNVMREEMGDHRAEVVHETESGNGAALTIRYLLPRGRA
jgi:hypothetical protein